MRAAEKGPKKFERPKPHHIVPEPPVKKLDWKGDEGKKTAFNDDANRPALRVPVVNINRKDFLDLQGKGAHSIDDLLKAYRAWSVGADLDM